MKSTACMLAVVVAIGVVVTSPAVAATLYILPDGTGDAPTIQAGLDACAEGDTVLVAAGAYFENLIWPAMDGLVLMSESGAGVTAIDGGGFDRVIIITTGVGESTKIDGFTIQNGYTEGDGAGILCTTSSSPTIVNNTITGNEGFGGGGICCSESSPAIDNNVITGNTAVGGGGIAWESNSSPTVTRNTIEGNHAYTGGGIFVNDLCGGTIRANLIDGNIAGRSGGGITSMMSTLTISGNTITGNMAGVKGGGIQHSSQPDFSTVSENDIIGNTSSTGAGINCEDGARPTITDCYIKNNNGDGVHCQAGGEPTINYNTIVGNSGYGVRNIDSTVTVDAKHNWWGNATGPYHPTENPGGLGDEVSDYVIFVPWLGMDPDLVSVEPELNPPVVGLFQVYPNPFNPQTMVSFALERDERASVSVYELTGKRVAVLADRTFAAGKHSLLWNGCDMAGRSMPSGTYLVHLSAESAAQSRKVLLLR